MVGSAVAMMVWFSAERNAASIRRKKMVRTSAWLSAARGAPAAAATSAGVAAPDLPDGERESCFRRCRTLIRTLARALAAAFEKFIATNDPDRRSPVLIRFRGDSSFNTALQHRALAVPFQRRVLRGSHDATSSEALTTSLSHRR